MADDDWEEIWNARIAALEQTLGPCDDQVLHAVIPFVLDGQADVVAFFQHLDGAVYVTAELTGKPDACTADYELMICHRSRADWGPNLISQLAAYSQQAYIGAGETMDLDTATPADSQIKAFLFDTYGTFSLFGQQCELRLCLGITTPELQYAMRNGAGALLPLLRKFEVWPFTDLGRSSIPLDA
jgi:hypothetical protein